MKKFLSLLVFLPILAGAEMAVSVNALPFNFVNEELGKIIETYSKASGAKFIIDPGVRGKASILNSQPVSLDEAYGDLSAALALNGFAISKRDNTLVIMSARNAQRSLVDVVTEVPALRPERMVTWIVTLKNTSADNINRDLRILTSRDGEMSVNSAKNQLIITDWTSNLHRVAETLKLVDIPTDPQVAKIVTEAKAARAAMPVPTKAEVKTPKKMDEVKN